MRSDIKITGPVFPEYTEHVVTPLLTGQNLSSNAARRLMRVTTARVWTVRPLYPREVQIRRAQFASDPASKPELPPPAIEHVRANGSSYELVDEQHSGMAYLEVHGTLTVWIVRRIRYDQA